MSTELIPYLLLLLAILAGWRFDTRISVAILVAAIIAGLAFDRLTPLSLIWIGGLGLSAWLPAQLRLNAFQRAFCYGAFLILAVSMSNHWVPGFNNFPVFQGIQFSSDSIAFSMYLNFDKTLVGLFIYLFFLKPHQPPTFAKRHWLVSVVALGMLSIVIVPVAFAIQYVRIDPKLPEFSWIWMLNNLFFVCLAEEALFRGFFQKGLSTMLPKTRVWSVVSIAVAAALFGFDHYKGGIAYIALATIAGLFYGYAYQRTDRLESSILVHFGLNMVHFLFFSYPVLVR